MQSSMNFRSLMKKYVPEPLNRTNPFEYMYYSFTNLTGLYWCTKQNTIDLALQLLWALIN